MKKEYSIGLTVHNLENPDILILFKCLINASINIDFIIYHQNYFKRKLLRFISTILGKDSDEKKIILKNMADLK